MPLIHCFENEKTGDSSVLSADKLAGDFSHWSNLKTIAMVESYRTEKGKPTRLVYRYYISSKALTAEQVTVAVREHWAIESMHWVLDGVPQAHKIAA